MLGVCCEPSFPISMSNITAAKFPASRTKPTSLVKGQAFLHLKRHLTRRQAGLTDRPSPRSRVAAFATRTSTKCVVSLDPNTNTIKKNTNLIWQYKYMTVQNNFTIQLYCLCAEKFAFWLVIYIDWLMIAYIALFSALLSSLTALACGATWVTSFL